MINPQNEMDIHELGRAVGEALRNWLDAHTNAKVWASYTATNVRFHYEQSKHGAWHWVMKGFDWQGAALLRFAQRYFQDFERCPFCGKIEYVTSLNCQCRPDADEHYETPDIDQLVEYLEKIDYEPDPSILLETLEIEGFAYYRTHVVGLTGRIEEDVQDCLDQLEGADAPESYLLAMAWGLHLQHVSGHICRDYSDGELPWELICELQEQGLESYFGPEAVEDFARSWA